MDDPNAPATPAPTPDSGDGGVQQPTPMPTPDGGDNGGVSQPPVMPPAEPPAADPAPNGDGSVPPEAPVQ